MTRESESNSQPLTFCGNDPLPTTRKQLSRKQLKQFLEILIEKLKENENMFPKLSDPEYQDDS